MVHGNCRRPRSFYWVHGSCQFPESLYPAGHQAIGFPFIRKDRLSSDRGCRGSWLTWRWRCTIRETARIFYWAHGRCQLPVGPMEFPGDSHESSQLPVTGFFETLKSQLSPQPVIVRDSGCGTRGGARVNTGSAPFYTSPTNRQFVHIRGPSTYNEIYKGNAFLLCFLFVL